VTLYVRQAGRWRHAHAWPIPAAQERILHLAPGGRLTRDASKEGEVVAYTADPTVGSQSTRWEIMGGGLGLARDQGPDDLRSLTFTSDPLSEPLEIAGSPSATLRLALDEGEELNVVVKLCDVGPDGSSTLITTGWLKASREGVDGISLPLPHGEFGDLELRLWATSYEVPAAHRIRASVACADFPRIWPTSANPRIRLAAGGAHDSTLLLPIVVEPSIEAPPPPPQEPSENLAQLLVQLAPRREIELDLVADAVGVTTGTHFESMLPHRTRRVDFEQVARAVVSRDHPEGARVDEQTIVALDMSNGSSVLVTTTTWQTAKGIAARAKVQLDGHVFFEREWRA
jgi:uncharacterized protein